MKIVDTFKHQGLRKRLMEQIGKQDFVTPKVLEAMSDIPRHVFVDDALAEHAYQDKAFPIAAGQTISQPSTVAYQSSLLNIEPTDIVLEIGTGSGYQTLVLAKLARYVLTIERQRDLFKQTKKFLPQFGYKNLQLFYGDGYKGLPDYAPFNKIIVTAAASTIPKALVEQLAPNGRMIVPVDNEFGSQTMMIIDKDSEEKIHQQEGKFFQFVPMLEGKNR